MMAVMRVVADKSREMGINNFPEIEDSCVGIVKRLRGSTGLSQKDFADAIGINQTVYNELENGKRDFSTGHVQAFKVSGFFEDDEIGNLRRVAALEFAKRKFDID